MRAEHAPLPSSAAEKADSGVVKRESKERQYPSHLDVGLVDALHDLPSMELETRLIGKGGEHLVFEFDDPKHKEIVYKVSYFASLQYPKKDLTRQETRDAAIERYVDEIEDRREDLARQRKYFGFQAVPAELAKVEELPVSRALIQKLRPGYLSTADPVPETLPALVKIQRRLNIDPLQSVSLNGGYAERPNGQAFVGTLDEPEEAYDLAHEVLTQEPRHALTSMERVMAIRSAIDMYPTLKTVKRYASNPAFMERLQDTVKRMVAYISETGHTLDVVGANNVVLLKEKDEWTLKLPDAVPMGDARIGVLRRAAEALMDGNEIPRGLLGGANNALHAVRFVNALALIANLPDRVIVPELAAVPAEEWRRALSKMWERTRAA